MKKIIALLLAMIMVLALAACAAKTEPAQAETTAETTAAAETTETTETAAPADGFKVAISLAEYNEWNKLYEAVIKEKCDEWGWTYEIFDSKQDASTQIDQVNSIIAQGFNAMTIQAVDNAALAPVVGQAADNGIIVVDHYGFADDSASATRSTRSCSARRNPASWKLPSTSRSAASPARSPSSPA